MIKQLLNWVITGLVSVSQMYVCMYVCMTFIQTRLKLKLQACGVVQINYLPQPSASANILICSPLTNHDILLNLVQ